MGTTSTGIKTPINQSALEDTNTNKKSESPKFTVGQLQEIIVKEYQPHSWWRYVLSCTFGLFWDEFKYSVPVYNLLDLCRNKNEDELINETAIKEALRKTSWFDWSFQKRTTHLNDANFFSGKPNHEDEKKLNTNEVIAKVLNAVK